jgi:hypothetical protein
LKETKNSMVTVPTILVGEESKKEKRVTDAYRLFGQMRPRGTSLAKRAAAAVIYDRSSNGREAWKVKKTGQTLKQWQDAQLEKVIADLNI